jgi:hypothetical protein
MERITNAVLKWVLTRNPDTETSNSVLIVLLVMGIGVREKLLYSWRGQ